MKKVNRDGGEDSYDTSDESETFRSQVAKLQSQGDEGESSKACENIWLVRCSNAVPIHEHAEYLSNKVDQQLP